MAEMLSNMAEKLANLAAEMLQDYTGIEENIQTLKTEILMLENRATDVVAVLEEEEIYNGKKRKREVDDWLSNVEKKKIKCESLNQEFEQTRFYNLYSCLRLGKLVKKTRLEVGKLVECGKFSKGIFLDVCKTKGKPLVTTEWKCERSLNQNLKTVWAWLMNDVDSHIGIYGMGGVGKTTLAMLIHNKLLSDPQFRGRIYWINVSQDSSIHKLQNGIANVVSLDLSSEDNENQRAAQLFEALKRRERFVIILDDVWNHFDIMKIGIPLGREGSKLLIISRSIVVCHRLGCQKNIKVEVLDDEEAWELFLNKLGCVMELPPDTETVAKEVVKRCAGLPLGIITMGGSIRGVTDIHEWRDALEELEESSMGPDDMENENSWEELISKFISEELMDRRNSREASFDQGHAILNKLENASLLERANSKYVKMHDLIRDMALRIARNDAGFMVKAGVQLYAAPEELSTLMLQRNPLEIIPDTFFLHMSRLQVLDLSYTWIEKLPNSTANLENLKALLLTYCVKLTYVPPLTKLRALKELDLNRNNIKELPPGMRYLINLKSLNMGCMSSLEMIPTGILLNLSQLQRLILPDHLHVQAEELQGSNNLEEFQGLFYNAHDLNQFIKSQQRYGQLSYYSIVVGKYDSWSRGPPDSKRLCDKLVTLKGYCFGKQRGEDKVCVGLNNCLSDTFPSLNSLRSLKSLRIRHCDEVDCISTVSPSVALTFPFQSLENLILAWKLFTLRMMQSFYSLEEVYVSECAEMVEIIGEDKGCEPETSYNDRGVITLPKLRALSLKWLPELRSICRLTMICDSIENIVLFECHRTKRLPFLKQIRRGKEDKEWWESLEWSHPNIKNKLKPFVKCLELGFQRGLVKPDWTKLVLACLFIRRLQVGSLG
ncbi:Apoptotic ATPase [Handroanthus impetiginosus]|uniref:Apoptotic ATPase n=1 Tax=Handroanthus impetiginosus TaxID=429701 RepID=A0A2G9HXJ4_9LAMI|nr:Apoptotic ATPase [Handroanthus impetiginosus]